MKNYLCSVQSTPFYPVSLPSHPIPFRPSHPAPSCLSCPRSQPSHSIHPIASHPTSVHSSHPIPCSVILLFSNPFFCSLILKPGRCLPEAGQYPSFICFCDKTLWAKATWGENVSLVYLPPSQSIIKANQERNSREGLETNIGGMMLARLFSASFSG